MNLQTPENSFSKNSSSRWIPTGGGALVLAIAHSVYGQAPAPATNAPPAKLPEVVVTGEAYYEEKIQGPFLPDVQGTRINTGKKTTVVDFDSLPQIQRDNYRQAFSQTPGLLTSEVPNASILSLGYRGIGDPHESQDIMVLKDGVPFGLDLLGYPTVYYAPPFEALDRLEFVRGGAALQYGPQPGGALNYITHLPRADKKVSLTSQHVFGSDSLYSTFNMAEGTIDKLGYMAYFDHRQGDGFRDRNQDFEQNGGSARLLWNASDTSRLILDLDFYAAESGEPGLLTRPEYSADREQSPTPLDRLYVERQQATLTYQQDVSEATAFEAKAWGGHVDRTSIRPGRDLASGNNENSEHDYYTQGLDARLRHNWREHTLAVGVTLYHSDTPLRTGLNTADADSKSFTTQTEFERETYYGALFAENKFTFGKFSVVPGVRLEATRQTVETVEDTVAPITPGKDTDEDFIPLFGIGLAYDLGNKNEAYANVSQSYKHKTYAEFIPTAAGLTVGSDLDPAEAVTYEAGVRGQPKSWLAYDTSLFLIEFDDKFGTVNGVVQNVGRTLNYGWDASVNLDLFDLSGCAERWGNMNLFANVELLHAEIKESANPALEGNEPQYAPDYLVRTGLIHRWKNRTKVSLLGTFVGDHWGDDANRENVVSGGLVRNDAIPAYMVWDLTAEVKVYKEMLRVVAGVNNLFDEDYYSRVRGGLIEPAYGRNYYAGLSLTF